MLAPVNDAFIAGERVLTYGLLSSTNTQAFALADQGISPPFWVVAQEQSEGRGRRGRAWVSAPGDLLVSVCLDLPLTPKGHPWLPLIAALSLHDAIEASSPGAGVLVALKWPNDLMIQRKKISGILLEGKTAGPSHRVVIGFGVNLVGAPTETEIERPATSLAAAGIKVTSQDLLLHLLIAMQQWLGVMKRGDVDQIRSSWLLQSVGLGEEISIRFSNHIETGRFVDLAQDGRLMLERKDGDIYHVSAGDVFLSESG